MTIGNSKFINRRRLVPAEPAKVSYWREKIPRQLLSFSQKELGILNCRPLALWYHILSIPKRDLSNENSYPN